MTNRITVYITKEQSKWIKNQPRSFNLSSKMRECLDVIMLSTLDIIPPIPKQQDTPKEPVLPIRITEPELEPTLPELTAMCVCGHVWGDHSHDTNVHDCLANGGMCDCKQFREAT